MHDGHLRSGLRGRRAECEALDQVVRDVRDGRSRVLVLRGEAGIGKSALLDHLRSNAAGCRVARAVGVESEMELPFAGLHQLCAPMLDHLDALPDPQRDALATAFGLRAGSAADRFLVGLAVLSLFAEVGDDQPLLCLVDDAQWLDRSSAQVLAFVARRLLAESVGIVAAVREPSSDVELRELPSLTIGGLDAADARALLDSITLGRMDVHVRDRVVAETRGNPLALLELPRGRGGAELAGGFAVPARPTLTSRIEQSFVERLEQLPADTGCLLLIAAAEPVGDTDLLWRAAEHLGIVRDAAAAAEDAGLIEIGGRVRFRHPLVRSAAYRAGSAGERRAAHRALAEVTDRDLDPDRRAWHLAHAASAPDEAVADELEQSAERATSRGGIAAAAAFLEHSAQLTPDPARRGARTLAAAHAMFEAAVLESADELAATAELAPLDDLQRALLARLRAQINFARHRGNAAPPLLLDAARGLHSLDDQLAREMYLEALGAALFAGRLGTAAGMTEVARAARSAPPAPDPPRPIDLLLDGLSTLVTDGYLTGVPALRRAVHPLQHEVLRTREGTMRWLWLASPIAQEAIVHHLWDFEAWDGLATRGVQLARDAGALSVLPTALVYLAGARLHAGDFAAATALIEEADAITTATGYARVSYSSLVLAAWRGDELAALERMGADVDDATGRGEGTVLGLAGYATAVLYNGLGRYDAARAGARQGCSDDEFAFVAWSYAELVEAAVRSGAVDEARTALAQLGERTSAARTDWALGVHARSAALLAEGPEADALYREAIERLERSRVAIQQARAHLLYGEWLRREQRRVEAREQLTVAHEMFERFGAAAFAERARREVLATGGSVRARSVEHRDVLTSQETQIARLAADGHTNPEIGGLLFISPRTVEYHLTKVFTKLEIGSRRELRTALLRVQGASAAT